MFRLLQMKHVRLLVMTDDLPQASLTLAETASFHPDPREPEEQRLRDQPGHDYRELYQQARSRLDKIAKLVTVDETPRIEPLQVVRCEQLKATNDLLGERWEQASQFEERLRRIDEEARFATDQEAALASFSNLKVDLGTLRNKTRFLDFYVGSVPRENVRRLEGAVKLADHLLFNYLQNAENAHVVIVGPSGEKEAQLQSVLGSAGFQALPIPQGLDNASPAKQREALRQLRAKLQRERANLRDQLTRWESDNHEPLLAARRTLLLAAPLATLDASIRGAGPLALLAGWVPACEVSRLQQRLRQTLSQPFAFEARDPLPIERPLVPSLPVSNRFLQPFAMLVKQYGIPEYGEVDPTPLFAITFLLMFGSMFGDVGQGAVIAGLAWLFRARLQRFALFGLLAGCSSMLFGFLYGSLFGYEDILPALWQSPIHHPILMLQIALGYGVLFLVVACSLAIYNRLAINNFAGALFGHHGVVNLIFYLALVWGGLHLGFGQEFGKTPMLLILLALGTLALYGWRQLDAPVGEKILVVFIETLETVIGYVSNTLSFLRVAAFSLNHAALSIAVLTLADMMGTTGHIITVILGNLFVLVLEGGIVMIQVLRLEFYEGFSRYFSGNGHEFEPLQLRHSRSAKNQEVSPGDLSPSLAPASPVEGSQSAR